jgi:glycosyltransferase involved in cell wall biosynthesis
MMENKEIVCLSSLDWDVCWTSKQQIMHRLSESNRVLYVEEPVTMLAPLLVRSHWRRWKALIPWLRHRSARLWTLIPPLLLPFGNSRSRVNKVNQSVLAHYVGWATRKLSFSDDYILWTYVPATVAMLDRLQRARRGKPAALVVYHCVDEHSAFPAHFISPELVKGYDDELTRRADLVITTSESLRKSREILNPHTYTVLNAADVEIFSQAHSPDCPVAQELEAIPTPRLGIVGVHDHRLDIEALEALVKAEPTWQLVLIGPLRINHVDEARLRSLPNIHLIGAKPQKELPSYLKGLSVALIPYKASELTRNIFPLKLFEYLAAGLPVVAGGLPELKRYAGMVSLAENAGDYPNLVRAAISEDTPEKRAERAALAAENSWEHRVEEISTLVEAALARKAQRYDPRPLGF